MGRNPVRFPAPDALDAVDITGNVTAGGTLAAVFKGGPAGATTALLFDVTGY